MKKIIFIHHAVGWGGAPGCMINLIKNLNHSKYDVEVLLLKNSEIADILKENNIKYRVAYSLFYKKYYKVFPHSEAGYIKWYQIFSFILSGISWILSRYIFAEKELAKHEFDIVHLNSSVLTDWLAPAKERGKVIIHIREPFRKGQLDLLQHFFKYEINKYADQIIAISKDNAKRIGIPAKANIIYDFAEIPANLPTEISYNSKKVLYLGGSSTSKGFYTLVRALNYLNKDVRIYFGGKYITDEKPKNIVQFLKFTFSKARIRNAAIKNISNHLNAKVIGLIYNVPDYLDEISCLVSPFLVPHFSFPVVEAHLHRKPAIGSDVEGMEEIIKHNQNGLIVPKNNPKALAYAINELTADSVKAKRFGEAGYNIAVQKFSSSNIQQFERLYDKL